MPRALTPAEEIELRRVALGAVTIDAQIAARLRAVALVEAGPGGLRLTPLGRQRYAALPSAPLSKPRCAAPSITGYIDMLLERAQRRGQNDGAAPTRGSRPS